MVSGSGNGHQRTRWERRFLLWGGSTLVGGALATAWLYGLSAGSDARRDDRLGAVSGISASACTPADSGAAAGVLRSSSEAGGVVKVELTRGVPSLGAGSTVDVRLTAGAADGADLAAVVGQRVALQVECRDGALAATSLTVQ